MTLKFTVPTLEGMDQSVASLYVADESGQGFRLDVEGAVSSKKLGEFRDNNIKLTEKLKAFEGIDPATYNTLLDLKKRVDENQLVASGEIDKAIAQRVTTMQTDHEKIVSELTNTNKSLQEAYHGVMIDTAIRFKASDLGVLPSAVDDVMLRAKGVFQVVDGQVVPHDGDKVLYGKDGINPMSVDEWIDSLSKKAPHLFNKVSGGGAGGSRSGNPGSGQKLTSVGKIAQGLGNRAK